MTRGKHSRKRSRAQRKATSEPPKRVSGAGKSEKCVYPAPLPRPDGFTDKEWLIVRVHLDTSKGHRNLRQVGEIADPNAVDPANVTWRALQKPHVQNYIAAVRELEVQQLGYTRAVSAQKRMAILEATEPSACRKVSMTEAGPIDGGIDSAALEVHRKTLTDLDKHLGLDKPVKVQVEHSGTVSAGYAEANAWIEGLMEKALGAEEGSDVGGE